jgi:two-component system, cell cycle response regulator CpdR
MKPADDVIILPQRRPGQLTGAALQGYAPFAPPARVVVQGRGSDFATAWPMARILIAEDDDQMRAFLSRGLRRAGHSVAAVGDGAAALVRAHRADYDLLLADIVMPGIDGIELARRVGAHQPGIRVMFITGFAAVAIPDDGFGTQRPPVLAKPFHLRHLIAEVEALLSR